MKNQAFPPKNPRICTYNRASGNVLILILICVALFGGLSFVMMQGGRNNVGNFTTEQAKLQATEMLGYANLVRGGLKAMLIDGQNINNISFQTYTLIQQNGAIYTRGSANCSQDSCRLFKPDGGNVKEVEFYNVATPLPGWQPTYIHVGGFDFMMADVKNVGTTENDIIMRIHGVVPQVCDAVNTSLGIAAGTVTEDVSLGTFYDTFDIPSYRDNTDSVKFGYTVNAIAGKKAFCDSASRTIYMVIQAL